MSKSQDTGLTYKDAGVDIEAADKFVETIGAAVKSTHGPEVLDPHGAFASLFRLNSDGLKAPTLAASCDGVGTKLLVAKEYKSYRGLGQDLVAMNVNDLLPCGARPLFFLDYLATGALEPNVLGEVVMGIANACKESGCALLGGETAEMPDLYRRGEFDLAGFAVGLVDSARLPDTKALAAGQVLLGLPSSGVHSNGFSLARKALFQHSGYAIDDTPEGLDEPLGAALLRPTELYVREVLRAGENIRLLAGAHITGGGLLGRLGKLVPDTLRLVVDPKSYTRPAIFDVIQKAGGISEAHMASTFNMGLGYVAVVSAEDADKLLNDATLKGRWLRVGEVLAGGSESKVDLGYCHSNTLETHG